LTQTFDTEIRATHQRAFFPLLEAAINQQPYNTTTLHTFKGSFSGTTRVSQCQKGKTNLDFTEARDSKWQWRQLGGMQVCTSLQTDNHVSTPPLSFLQAGCPSCRPTSTKYVYVKHNTGGMEKVKVNRV